MIKYALRCADGHTFESWFKDSAAFDSLRSLGELQCPNCGSTTIDKAVMAPSLVRGGKADREIALPATVDPQPVAMMGERERELRDMVRALHRKIVESSENVGPSFPEEARRIHDGEAPKRPIYGQATGDEVRSLVEDGVPILPIPSLPDDSH